MSFMDGMMGNMSSKDKQQMMEKMMSQFFSDMTDDEKKEMVNNMMPKMMSDGSSMMGAMMGKMGKDGINPMDMCKKMMGGHSGQENTNSLMTPEIKNLFDEWVGQINEEVMTLVTEKKLTDPKAIAKELNISKESALYFLMDMARQGKINIKCEKVN